MSGEANLQTIEDVYEAFGRGDVATILEKVTDDVDWAADTTSTAAPWYGQRTGKEAVAAFFAAVAGVTEVLEFTPLSFAASDSEVHTLVHYRARFTSTGREIDMNLHHFFRMTDGKIAYYRGSEDTAQTLAALGT
jgi:ketosteroid isomerase-like protein